MAKQNKIIIEKEICPRCGREFNCGKSSKCWCYEMDIPVETLETLQQDYESCICPDCLKEYSR